MSDLDEISNNQMKKVPIEGSKDSLKLKNKNYMFYPLLIIILSIGIIVCFYITLYIKNLKKNLTF